MKHECTFDGKETLVDVQARALFVTLRVSGADESPVAVQSRASRIEGVIVSGGSEPAVVVQAARDPIIFYFATTEDADAFVDDLIGCIAKAEGVEQ